LKSSFSLRFKARRAEGECGGGIPPAEPSQFRSDIFKQTPKIKFSKICQRKSTFKEYQKFVKTIAKKFENSNGEIIGENMSKLKKRYPKEFTTERAKRKMVD